MKTATLARLVDDAMVVLAGAVLVVSAAAWAAGLVLVCR